MTIHHDKLAYGKLASQSEDVSAERLKAMLKKLNGEEEQAEDKTPKPENKKNGANSG